MHRSTFPICHEYVSLFSEEESSIEGCTMTQKDGYLIPPEISLVEMARALL